MMNREINIDTAVYTSAHNLFVEIRDNASDEQFDMLKSKVKALNDFTLIDVCMRILSGVDEFLTDENSAKWPSVSVRRDGKTHAVKWDENLIIIQPSDIVKAFNALHEMEVKAKKEPAEQTKYPFGDNLQAKINKAIRVCFGYAVRVHVTDTSLAQSFIDKYHENPRIIKQLVDENGKRAKDSYSKNSLASAINEVLTAIKPDCKNLFNNDSAALLAESVITSANVKRELNSHNKKGDKAIQLEIINKVYSHIVNATFKLNNVK